MTYVPNRKSNVPASRRPRIPESRDKGIERTLQRLQKELDDRASVLNLKVAYASIGYKDLAQMATAGDNYIGLLTLPPGGGVLQAWAWVTEPVLSAGTPRGGFVALTVLGMTVGTLIAGTIVNNKLLTTKSLLAYSTWSVAADHGVFFNADARISPVGSFTDRTQIRACFTPNANGDMTLITAGRVKIVLVYTDLA